MITAKEARAVAFTNREDVVAKLRDISDIISKQAKLGHYRVYICLTSIYEEKILELVKEQGFRVSIRRPTCDPGEWIRLPEALISWEDEGE